MEYGHDGFQGRFSRRGVNINGNAPAIVGDGDRTIGIKVNFDMGAIASEGFIDRVIDDFIDEVMESTGPSGADVHPRTFAYRV